MCPSFIILADQNEANVPKSMTDVREIAELNTMKMLVQLQPHIAIHATQTWHPSEYFIVLQKEEKTIILSGVNRKKSAFDHRSPSFKLPKSLSPCDQKDGKFIDRF
jgi:hypothetical protein